MSGFVPPQPLDTPVLLLVFNRPEPTFKVFAEIRRARPPRLYIAADGPRDDREGEADVVNKVREIATAVDWDCEVKTLFRGENLGCKYAPISAITWFFENEEQGIILEDDCLPNQSFFWFCDELLNRYKNDNRIWDIAGSNPEAGSTIFSDNSYLYSRYGGIWGWATWRDRWRGYDSELLGNESSGLLKVVCASFEDWERPDIRLEQFQSILDGLDAWDYQWLFHRVANSGLSVVPHKNLISNIGFGDDATHTKSPSNQNTLPRHDISFPLKEPPSVVRDLARDKRLIRNKFKHRQRSLPRRLMSKLYG